MKARTDITIPFKMKEMKEKQTGSWQIWYCLATSGGVIKLKLNRPVVSARHDTLLKMFMPGEKNEDFSVTMN